MDYKEEFIEFMVKSGVLTFGEFTTKSGRPTPYFINTGNYRTAEQIAKLGGYYAECVRRNDLKADLLFGPAYKGIPLVTTTAIGLWSRYGEDVLYSFNRKEAKDHGEGGSIIGAAPTDGQRVLIVEDVVTAGTSVRESVALLKSMADVDIVGLVISVDRMEVGPNGRSATQEIEEEFGIRTYPIVTIREVIDALSGKEIDGKVVIDDALKAKMEEHLKRYGSME